MLRQYFKAQIETHPTITADVFAKIEYRRVWSGKQIEINDKVLYAFVYPKGEDDYKFMAILERELNELENLFDFIEFERETIPVLKFKDDSKIRKPQND